VRSHGGHLWVRRRTGDAQQRIHCVGGRCVDRPKNQFRERVLMPCRELRVLVLIHCQSYIIRLEDLEPLVEFLAAFLAQEPAELPEEAEPGWQKA
jgi:hypothetical protein